MSLSPVIGTEVPETANGVLTSAENGPHSSVKSPGPALNKPTCTEERDTDKDIRQTDNGTVVSNNEQTVFNNEQSGGNNGVALQIADIIQRTAGLSVNTESVNEATDAAELGGATSQGGLERCSDGAEEGEEEEEGEKEKQDEEEDEKKWRNQHTSGRTQGQFRPSHQFSSSAPGPSSASCPSPPLLVPSEEPPCPPHVMAEVWVRNVRGMQDSKSLDEISQAYGADCSGPIYHSSRSGGRRPVDIPPIDPSVLVDLHRHTQEVAQSVEAMMKSLNGTIQNMTALSVGYIQTYRDSVDSLGESVDMSIKGMYTLMARCEELDRSMQPIHGLAAQIRDIKRTLDALEAICK
ncbi:BLOC-1 related complex subunit 6 isoform X2 [Periophthalmus magnuspinnatus]|uniref:BLOC-1 related complex subunit 6 isoform X2 n=1 Tax=Periophthalmus magnuspinnatus TaxID=409849 RepID=UPI002436FC08|nr:BLOC-1 related complex subunit 6 isoform X2 [Periophthalmus magnuspinnatus]